MNAADVLVWVLRVVGALYLVGGVWMARQTWFWARMGRNIDALMNAVEHLEAETQGRPLKPVESDDAGRSWWLFAGAVLTACAGAAMLLTHAAAVALLAAIIVHQLFYFIRQRRRELRAANAEAAAEERPQSATVNGFFGALVMAVLAAWLYREGALWF